MKKLVFLLPAVVLLAAAFTTNAPSADPTIPADVDALLNKNGCNACHSIKRKLVGPIWTEIGAKGYSKKKIISLVKKPVPANWPGYPAMAPLNVPKAEMEKIADWLVTLK